MLIHTHTRTADGKLKIMTVLSSLAILVVLILSLVSISSSSLPSSLSSLSSSCATFSPFTSGGNSRHREISVPSADGLMGDFLPEMETRASQGALKSLGQKKTFKENLRADKRYLTAWPVAGWNNQVICFMNLIYFAIRSGRIPILPDFTPHNQHLNAERAPLLRFGQVFDIPRLSALLKTPIVEFTELKGNGQEKLEVDKWKYDDEFPEYQARLGEWVDDAEPEWEDVGCWSWAKATRLQDNQGGGHYLIHQENTPLPQAALGNDWDHGIAIKPFINILKPSHPAWNQLDEWQTELIANNSERIKAPEILPAHDVACVDEMYFLDKTEMQSDVGTDALIAGIGPWNEVGRYMYFAPRLRAITHGYLRRVFELNEDDKVPTYVAVHIRRGDLSDFSHFTPIDYAFRVAEVLRQTQKFLGFLPERVVVMTDETNESWLRQFKELGWYHFDHAKEQTAEKYGPWYTTLIDGVALSEGVGFVGLSQSTMSDLAYQRVRTWHGGVGVLMHPDMEPRTPEGYVYPYAPDAV